MCNKKKQKKMVNAKTASWWLVILTLLLDSKITMGDSVEQKAAAERFKKTFSFLKNSPEAKKRFRVHFVKLPEGNYTGELNDKRLRHGWGEMEWTSGATYGPGGVFKHSEGDRYVGQWRDGLQNGIGTFTGAKGVYIGDWSNGLQSGNGTVLFENGNKFIGQFLNGLKHGYGTFTLASGDVFRGYYKHGVRHGQGMEMFVNGEKYVGGYLNDLRSGKGVSYDSEGNIRYAGDWKEGKPHGTGTLHLPNGMRYEGEFQNGQMGGVGTVYNPDGTIQVRNGMPSPEKSVSSLSSSPRMGDNLDNDADDDLDEEVEEGQKREKKKNKREKKRRKTVIQSIGSMIKSILPFK